MHDYEPDVSQILALYQQLEDDMISSMTKRMLKMGKVSESTKYEAEILQSAGLLYEDILNLIAQRTEMPQSNMSKLYLKMQVYKLLQLTIKFIQNLVLCLLLFVKI